MRCVYRRENPQPSNNTVDLSVVKQEFSETDLIKPKGRLKKVRSWTDEETRDLLLQWKCYKSFNDLTFQKVAESMRSLGHPVTTIRCYNKVSSVVQEYRKVSLFQISRNIVIWYIVGLGGGKNNVSM